MSLQTSLDSQPSLLKTMTTLHVSRAVYRFGGFHFSVSQVLIPILTSCRRTAFRVMERDVVRHAMPSIGYLRQDGQKRNQCIFELILMAGPLKSLPQAWASLKMQSQHCSNLYTLYGFTQTVTLTSTVSHDSDTVPLSNRNLPHVLVLRVWSIW